MPKIVLDTDFSAAQGPAPQFVEAQYRVSPYSGYTSRGVWSVATSYNEGDWVTYGESDWAAVTASLGVTPGSNTAKWTRIDDTGEWEKASPQAPGNSVVIDNVQQGVSYDVRLRNWMNDGSVSDWTKYATPAWISGGYYTVGDRVKFGSTYYQCIQTTNSISPGNAAYWTSLGTSDPGHQVIGKNISPANVTGFTALALGGGLIKLAWDAVPNLDIDHYEIRSGASWAAGVVITNAKALNTIISEVNVGVKTYWIKAVDTAGNLSTTATSVAITINLNQVGAVYSIIGTSNQVSSSLAMGSVTLFLTGPHAFSTQTNHGVLLGRGTAPIGALAPVTTGYLLASGANNTSDPVWKLLSAGAGIQITNAAGEITITNTGVIGGSGSVDSITGTAHQIIASAATGPVVLSTPQDIDTTSDVQFGSLFMSGSHSGVGRSTALTLAAVGYTTLFDIDGGAGISALQLFTSDTSVNSAVGDIIFGTSATADADKRLAIIRGAIDQSSVTDPYGRLEFWTNEAGTWHQALTIGRTGTVTVGSLDLPTTAAVGDVFYASNVDVMGRIAAVASGSVLASNGANAAPVYKNVAAGAGISIAVTGSTITITNTGGGGGGAGVTSLTGTAHQIIASAATGAVTLSAPQDIDTTSAVRHATLTLGAALPASTTLAAFPAANNYTAYYAARFTDTAPTGKYISFWNAAKNSELFSIDITGSVLTGIWKGTTIDAQHGGTGNTTYAIGDILYASGVTTLSRLAAGTDGYVLTANGAGVAPTWQAATGGVGLDNPAHVATGDLLMATGTDVIGVRAAVAAGQLLSSNGLTTAPVWDASPWLSSSLRISASATPSSGTATESIMVESNTGARGVAYFTASSATANGPIMYMRGSRGAVGAETVSQSGDYLGFFRFMGCDANTTFDYGPEMRARTTELWSTTAHGSQLVFYTVPNGSVTLTLAVTIDQDQSLIAAGGLQSGSLTIPTTAAAGSIFYASGTNAMGTLADVTAGSYLRSGGAGSAPVWSTLTLPNAATTGDLLMATGTNAIGTRAAVAAGQVLTSVDVATAPVWSDSPRLAGLLRISNSLDAANGTAAQSLLVESNASGHAAAWFTVSAAGAYGPNVYWRASRGALGSETATQSGDRLGAILFHGFGASTYGGGAFIGAYSTQIFTEANRGTKLVFYTVANNTDTPALALTLDQDQSATFAGALTATGITSGSLVIPTAATKGDIFFASAANTMDSLADVAAGSYLRSGGVAANPVWSTLTLPNAATTGDLLMATGTNAIGVRAAVAAGQVLSSVDVATAPVWSASPYLSTGVLVGVTGGAAVGTAQFKSDSNTSNNIAVLVSNASAGNVGPTIALRHARGSIGGQTATQSGDVLGMVYFEGFGDTVWAGLNIGSNVRSLATETHTDTARGSDLRFYTVTTGGVVVTEALRLVGDSITVGKWAGTAIDETHGGTGKTVYAVGDLLYADSTTSLARLADITAGSYLRSGGAGVAPVWSTLVLPNAATTGDLLYASGTNTIGVLNDVIAGSYLRSGGAGVAPVWSTLVLPNAATTGDILVASGTNTIGVRAAVAAGSYLRSAGASTLPVWSTLVLPNAATTGDILIATGTNTITSLADAASGQLLQSQGAGVAPAWTPNPYVQATANGQDILTLRRFTNTGPNGYFIKCLDSGGASNVFSVLATGIVDSGTWSADAIGAQYGGTGQTLYAQGDLLYASSTTALSRLADVAAGSYLRSGGVGANPLWSTLTLPNAATTGDLLMATGSNAIGVRAAVAVGSVLASAGASTAPTWNSTVYLAGKLGIGETAAAGVGGIGQTTIEVNGGASTASINFITSATAINSAVGGLYFSTTGTAQANQGVALILASLYAASDTNVFSYLRFYTADGGTYAEKMRLGNASAPGTTGTWLELVGSTANYLSYGTIGIAVPGSDSVGAKIQLYGTLGTIGASDYSIGVETSYAWFNTTTNGGFKFYQNDALIGAPVNFARFIPTWYSGVVTSEVGDILTSGRSIGLFTFANLPCYKQVILSDSPGGYWRLNEASGNFTDSTANGNTGTTHGTITYAQVGGILHDYDYCVSMAAATSDYISVATNASLPSGDTFTVEFAFKRSATQSVKQYLVCQAANGFGIFFDSTNHLAIEKVGVGTICTSTATYTSTAAWYYVQIVKNAGTSCQIIVNGVDVSGAVSNQTIAPASAAVNFGASTAPASYYTGFLDEIAIWPSVVTLANLKSHYQEYIATKLGRVAYCTDSLQVNPATAGGSGGMVTYGRWGGASNTMYCWLGAPVLTIASVTYAIGDLLYASGTGTLAKLADVATGACLVSGGVGAAPSYSTSPTFSAGLTVGSLTIPTTAAIGTLFYASAANQMGSLATVAAGSVLTSNGAAAPVWSADPSVTTIKAKAHVSTAVTITYSASMTPNLASGDYQVITATNSTAFTINAPTNPTSGQHWWLRIANGSGGAVGAITWATGTVFKVGTWVAPANGKSRIIEFLYDGATHWAVCESDSDL